MTEHDLSYHAYQAWLRKSDNSPYKLPDDLSSAIEKVMKQAHSYLMTFESSSTEEFLKDFPEIVSLARTYGDIHPHRKECLTNTLPELREISLQRTISFAKFMAEYGLDEMDDYYPELKGEFVETFSFLKETREDTYGPETEIVTADTSVDDPEDETVSWRV